MPGAPTLPHSTRSSRLLFTDSEWKTIFRGLSLSLRQGQIVRMLFDGYSDKQIAQSLHISVPTVRSHLQRMYAKLRVQDRTTLAVYIFAWFRHNGRK